MTIEQAKQLLKAFEKGEIAKLEVHEVYPGLDKGSRENYLYFSLPVALNFQRNSPAMWKAALATYEDPKTNFAFFPEKSTAVTEAKLRQALTQHKLAIQLNKHTRIWQTISNTLHADFKDDPRKVIKACGNDAAEFIAFVQSHKQNFPYLGGPKLSNYWAYMLSLFTDVRWKKPESISIIPDTHVIRSSVRLGLVKEGTNALEVAEAWQVLLEGSNISPSQMHSVLWHWSRSGFEPAIFSK